MNRFAVLSCIGASLVLAACGGSATAATSSPSPSPGGAGTFRGGAAGQLVQINPQTLVLSGAGGDITVDYTSSTTITKTSTATLADIAPGMCIVATGQKDAAGMVTATSVRLSPRGAKGCTAGGFTGTPAPGASPRPSPSPRPVPSGQPTMSVVSGEVTAVSGISVTILTPAKASLSITVPTTATVSQSSVANIAALQVGQCLRANGSRDASGNVQATALTISPPGPSGTCSTGLGFGGRQRGAGAPTPGG
jgi:uncharacterized protein DUF5666